MKAKLILIYTVTAMLLCVTGYFVARYYIDARFKILKEIAEAQQTKTTIQVDTITLYAYQVDTIKTKYIKDTLQLTSRKIIEMNDTIYGTVIVPLTTQTIKQDGLFEATITGYKTKLDSIKLYQTTITKQTVLPKYTKIKPYRLYGDLFVVQSNYTYPTISITNEYKFIYVNTGIQYNIQKSKFMPYISAGLRLQLN